MRHLEKVEPFTRERARQIDSVAMDRYGIPGIVLMENAGLRSADIILSALEEFDEPRSVTILAGKGHNGGDGYVIARHLHNHGVNVNVMGIGTKNTGSSPSKPGSYIETYGSLKRKEIAEKYGLKAPEEDVDEADVNLAIAQKMGIRVVEVGTELELENIPHFLEESDIVVDALLGSGIQGAPREPYDKLIEMINDSGSLVFSVDLPSGLDVNTGETPGKCVRADHTITFAAAKKGFFKNDGPDMCGRIHIVDISVPRAVYGIEGGDEE